jgi:hypothetical protein
MKKCAVLAMLAGTLAGVASAQSVDSILNAPTINKAGQDATYGNRDVQVIYNVGTTSETGGDWRSRGGAHTCGGRFSFTPGPGATVNPILVNGVGFACDQDAAGVSADSSFTIRWSFYLDPVGGTPVSATALPANPDFVLYYDASSFCTPGYITYYSGAPLTWAGFTFGSATKATTGFCKVQVFKYQQDGRNDANGNPTTPVLNPSVGPALRGLCAPNVGSNDGVRWADANNDGTFVTSEGLGSLASRRNLYLNLAGDVPPPPPPAFTELGCIPDAGISRAYTLTSGQVKWFHMCLNGDASISARQYLGIDTNGSTTNCSIALYKVNGTLAGYVGTDADDGDSTNAMLSFGIGNHAGSGDSLSFDGRDGDVLAGEYYIAVAGDGATFGPSFNAAGGTAAGPFQFHVTTNTNGGALPPASAPSVRSGNDLGVLSAPGTPGTNFTLSAHQVDWYKFELCSDITAPLYLDLDFSATGTSIADPQSYLFDSNGVSIATSDDGSASYNRPQFSFGAAGPRTQGSSPVAFNGSSGATLPRGVYYLATGLYSVSSSLDRWNARSESGSSLSYQVDFYTNLDSSTCSSACSPCAADYNQDGGVDGGDIASFFPDWEASAACADVNQDGGVDGGDIESFFAVWQAGGC